jgi:uncharacterized DUF497 family protein
VEFEWDDGKSESTLKDRRFDFAFAAGIFNGPVVESHDTRKNYGEVRIKAIGETHRLVLAVIYTDRDGFRRIISARLASKKERAQWRSFVRP